VNKTQALAQLRKLYGDNVGYRVNKGAKPAAERKIASDKANALYPEQQRLIEARNARAKALLDADVEYQGLVAAVRRVTAEREALQSVSFMCPISVGVISPLAFHIKIEGDNWEEVVQEAKAKKGKS
jgi:hypothetical protein